MTFFLISLTENYGPKKFSGQFEAARLSEPAIRRIKKKGIGTVVSLSFIVILFFLFECGVNKAWAQKDVKTQELLLKELESVRNPFKPLVEKKVIKIVEKVEVKPVVPVQVVAKPPVVDTPKPVEKPAPVRVVLPKIVKDAVPKVDLKTLKIRGLIWDTYLPQAIVDDRVVYVGDVVLGAKILSITKDGIAVMNNGVKQTLNISEDLPSVSSNVKPAKDVRRTVHGKK